MPEARTIGDERVVERDEGVEEQRLLAGDATCARDVEVARVPDDDGVERVFRGEAQPELRHAELQCQSPARRPVVPAALPHGCVPLDHLDACPAERGHHLGVPRIVALVSPEVEDAQR